MADASGNGRLDRLEGAVAILTSAVGSLTDVTRVIADQVNRLAEAHIQTEENLAELAESQQRLAESQRVTEESIRQLTEAQHHTDERLNALIAIVDDLIRRRTPPPPTQ